MRHEITKIRGLTVNVIIEEVHHQHEKGGLICYFASIYIQRHGSTEKRLVRRSRLPGAAEELRKEVQKDGLRAFDRLMTCGLYSDASTRNYRMQADATGNTRCPQERGAALCGATEPMNSAGGYPFRSSVGDTPSAQRKKVG